MKDSVVWSLITGLGRIVPVYSFSQGKEWLQWENSQVSLKIYQLWDYSYWKKSPETNGKNPRVSSAAVSQRGAWSEAGLLQTMICFFLCFDN